MDEPTRLAGASKLEILLFSLGADAASGRNETYAIDVVKVREVIPAPVITRGPDMPPAVAGMVSLRGALIPVIDLARYARIETETPGSVLIVAEYGGSAQGFLVEAVDAIVRLDWSAMMIPPAMLASRTGGLINAVTRLPDARLAMMIDTERLLAATTGTVANDTVYRSTAPLGPTRAVPQAGGAQEAGAVRGHAERAGLGCMELLVFSLGGNETFGINVFKVREVALTPRITRTPHTPPGVPGVIALRGSVIPVIDLACFLGIESAGDARCGTLLVTELCGRVQGFLVGDVDRIVRVDRNEILTPDPALTGNAGMVSAITRLPDGHLVSILDVEQILADAFGGSTVAEVAPIESGAEFGVLFADDSPLARREIIHVLDQLGVRHQQASNGREAWEKLQAMALTEGAMLRERLCLVLTDAEMPEMDGYELARNIKSDRRFDGIPIVMHTSLSARANSVLSAGAGIDAFVAKFDALHLANTLRPLLQRSRLAA